MNMNRRQFLRTSTAAAAAFGAVPLIGQDAFGHYKTALIGCGWWGNNILGEALQYAPPPPGDKKCKIVALCDVDQSKLDSTIERVGKLTGELPRKYRSYLELLEQERPEVVIIATPDHWHARQTVDAVKAGAHVYVEKPVSHTIREGQAMVKAARKYGRTVQVGLHRRVSPHNISAMKFLREGKAGKIGFIRAFVEYDWARQHEAPTRNEDVPKGLDWDAWCGPAPLRPYSKLIHPKGFRQFLDYANGTLGDWGVHWLDQVLWWSEEKWPKRVCSTGGRPILGPSVNLPDYQTTDAPDSQSAVYEFDSFTLAWEHRMFAGNTAEKGENVGCFFYGTEGTFHLGWQNGWTFYPHDKSKAPIGEPAQLHEPDQQNIKELWADFMAAIMNHRLPVCDIEIGHLSTNLSLLGMLSMKAGRSVQWNGVTETIVGDPYASSLLQRQYRPGYDYPVVL